MKAKKIVTILLLVFIAGSIVFMIAKESKTEPSQDRINPPESEVSAESNDSAQAEHKTQIIVYYFHGDMRCVTCQRLQNYAKEALDTYFEKELASGEIIWSEINVDRAENRHFIQDYSLVTKSVVLSKRQNGQQVEWRNLDQIWQKVRSKEDYIKYIHESVLEFTEESKL
ncbi:MAG: nitrophenyl compound nitroreductase subunit ArsF family protein [Phycisphaerae bacterium]